MIIQEKNKTSSKTSFQMTWHEMVMNSFHIGGGRIFRNGVMHANMAEL
jgi:hypothetical protein